MWLSEKSGLAGIETPPQTDMGRVSIGGASPAVITDGEHRDAVLLSPLGVSWLPEAGREAVLLRCGDGTEVLLGCAQKDQPAGMQPGEVYITSGTASVYIRKTGDIIINGTVNINGSLTVNGEAV